jgi:hypothetical protein
MSLFIFAFFIHIRGGSSNRKKLCLADDNIDSQQLHYQKKNKGVGVKCVNDQFSRERANETTFTSHKNIEMTAFKLNFDPSKLTSWSKKKNIIENNFFQFGQIQSRMNFVIKRKFLEQETFFT